MILPSDIICSYVVSFLFNLLSQFLSFKESVKLSRKSKIAFYILFAKFRNVLCLLYACCVFTGLRLLEAFVL